MLGTQHNMWCLQTVKMTLKCLYACCWSVMDHLFPLHQQPYNIQLSTTFNFSFDLNFLLQTPPNPFCFYSSLLNITSSFINRPLNITIKFFPHNIYNPSKIQFNTYSTTIHSTIKTWTVNMHKFLWGTVKDWPC